MDSSKGSLRLRTAKDLPAAVRTGVSLYAAVTRRPFGRTAICAATVLCGFSPAVVAYLVSAPWFGWMFAVIFGLAAVVTASAAWILDVE